jgi:hypothetical protein
MIPKFAESPNNWLSINMGEFRNRHSSDTHATVELTLAISLPCSRGE